MIIVTSSNKYEYVSNLSKKGQLWIQAAEPFQDLNIICFRNFWEWICLIKRYYSRKITWALADSSGECPFRELTGSTEIAIRLRTSVARPRQAFTDSSAHFSHLFLNNNHRALLPSITTHGHFCGHKFYRHSVFQNCQFWEKSPWRRPPGNAVTNDNRFDANNLPEVLLVGIGAASVPAGVLLLSELRLPATLA
jgi:sarcosine oxidase delta subunit